MVKWSTQKLGAQEVCSLNPAIFILGGKMILCREISNDSANEGTLS